MPKNGTIVLIAVGAALGSSLTLALLKLISRNKSFKNSKQAVSSIQYKGQDIGIAKNGYSTSSVIEREADAKTEISLFSDDLLNDEIVHEHLTRNIQFFGLESQQKVNNSFVVVIGLGGVGSHAATMLLRSGVGRIRIVDFDQVSLSSLNRHAVATREDVGTSKALCLKNHFQSIFPESQIDARVQLYDASSEEDILGGQPDFILDCIDNIDTKVSLLAACVRRGLKVLSATGAGARADPTRIRIADISESSIDPLSRAVRHRLRREHGIDGGISVVFSLEKPKVKLLPFKGPNGEEENPSEYQIVPGFRVRIIPVLGTIPAIFGQVMASHVLTQLSGFYIQTEPVVSFDVDYYCLLHQRLIEHEEILYGTAMQVEVQGMRNDGSTLRKESIIREASRIVSEEGVRAFWKGNLVTIAHRLPYSSISFYAYERYKKIMHSLPVMERYKENISTDLGIRLLGGGAAGVTAATLTYPLDLIRTRLAAQVEEKMWIATKKLEQRLVSEQSARKQAEEVARLAQERSDEQIRRLQEKLEKAHEETENLKKQISKCVIL